MDGYGEDCCVGVLEQVSHHHLTCALQGLLPPSINAHKLKRVLDINCQTGAWAIDLALTYSDVHVIGLDSNPHYITTARINAEAGNLSRVHFYESSATRLLNFAENSFDLIRVALPAPLLRCDEWPAFLQQCMHIMKPGAYINPVSMSPGPGSSTAYQRMLLLNEQLMYVRGYSMSKQPGPASPGIYLCRLLNEARFTHVTYTIHPVNFGGWNNTAGRACCQLLLDAAKRNKPLFLEHNLISSDEFDELLSQEWEDINHANFCATGALISAVAVKGL